MSILKALKWFLIDQFTFGVGGDGGGTPAPSTTNVQNSNLPEYVRPYVEGMLGSAQQQIYNMNSAGNITGFKGYTPYSTNMQDYQASFSPMQQQSFQGAAQLQTPGQFQAGSQLAGASGMGSLGVAGQAGAMGQAGNQYNAMATNPYATQAFMNPYLNASLQPQLQEMARQYGITGTQEQSQATQAGAFGGSREALMAAENQRNKNTAMNQAIGTGYNNAFQAAQQAQQFGANIGLQGQQAAANAALQGYGQANNAAGTLGQLGQQQLTGQEGILGIQNTYGGQQQAQQQNMINQAIQNYATAQQYPMMQLGNMSNLLHGLPMQSSTTQSYQAQPGIASQIGALGTGAIGLSKLAGAKAGGSTKEISKRGTGIDEMHLHELLSYKE
jgi:hypothetical protein